MSEHIISTTWSVFEHCGSQTACRLFEDLEYQAQSWSQPRRIIVKAERLPDGNNLAGRENTRYIVTNMKGEASHLYENIYCARGEMENRIKEQQLMLFADRTSCHHFTANRFRLLLSSFAYVLMEAFRRTVLCGTEMAKAQCSTIREKLLKVAAIVKESARRFVFSMADHYPYQELWNTVVSRLAKLRAAVG